MTRILTTLSVAALTAGLASAQSDPRPPRGRGFGGPPPGPGLGPGPGGPGMGPGLNENRLNRALNLNATQQNQIHTAFQEAQVLMKGVPEKTAELNKQLSAAIKSGNEGEIDRITQDLARQHQMELAVRSKTLAKVYGALTPEQKAMLDQEIDRGPGMGRGPGPGQRPPIRRQPGTQQ